MHGFLLDTVDMVGEEARLPCCTGLRAEAMEVIPFTFETIGSRTSVTHTIPQMLAIWIVLPICINIRSPATLLSVDILFQLITRSLFYHRFAIGSRSFDIFQVFGMLLKNSDQQRLTASPTAVMGTKAHLLQRRTFKEANHIN